MTIKIDVYMDDGRDYYVATFNDIRFIEILVLSKEYVILRLLLRFYNRCTENTPTAVTSKGLRIAYIGHKAKKQLKFALKRIYRDYPQHVISKSVRDISKLSTKDLENILYKIIDLESYLILITCS